MSMWKARQRRPRYKFRKLHKSIRQEEEEEEEILGFYRYATTGTSAEGNRIKKEEEEEEICSWLSWIAWACETSGKVAWRVRNVFQVTKMSKHVMGAVLSESSFRGML